MGVNGKALQLCAVYKKPYNTDGNKLVIFSGIASYYGDSIIIVQSYTGKYHKFVAICIVTSAQHE